MNRIKKITIYCIIVISFFIWGLITSHYKIFPYSLIKIAKISTFDKIYKIKKNPKPYVKVSPLYIEVYSKEMNIFTDRKYYNHKNDEKLLNFFIIRNLRHSTKNIRINFINDVEIYRAICKKNHNNNYNNWEIADFTIAIVGTSCVHNKIVKKKFKKGEVVIKAGGPIASDPIFILGNLNIDKTKINN
tara:strand:- start:80 stop:643 length:564 start_codon:yes stop_codon:yes gene_type:complete